MTRERPGMESTVKGLGRTQGSRGRPERRLEGPGGSVERTQGSRGRPERGLEDPERPPELKRNLDLAYLAEHF